MKLISIVVPCLNEEENVEVLHARIRAVFALRRLATMAGFALPLLSLLVALGYFVAKLVMWHSFSLGMATMVIGLLFIGILGEYIGAIHTQVLKRPLVVEKERVNFDEEKKKE